MRRKKQQNDALKETQNALIRSQAERIEELRKENADLAETVEAYRSREKEIADAVVFGKKQQEDYLTELKIRYALENERLKRFLEKLEKFRSKEELIRSYDDTFSALKETKKDLERVLREDLGEGTETFIAERERLGDVTCPWTEENASSDIPDALTKEELEELLEQL